MLKVTIDSSLLNSKKNGEFFKPKITVLLAGLHWEEGEEIPAPWKESLGDKEKENIQKILFPWNWNKPNSLLIFWLDKDRKLFKKEVVNRTSTIKCSKRENDYFDDAESLSTNYYEKILNDGLGLGKEDIKLLENQILWDSTEKVIEVYEDFKEKKKSTGFLNASIGQFAQKLPPLNQQLKMVFFFEPERLDVPSETESLVVPDDAEHFVVFPVGGVWWKVKENIKPIKNDKNSYRLDYFPTNMDQYDANKSFRVISSITPILIEDNKNQNPTEIIKLRDTNGDFEGTVKINAFDIDDYTDTLLDKVSVHFDLPALMLQFVEEKKIDDNKILKKINAFLWATLRDSLGFGHRVSSKGNSIVTSIVKQYCDDTKGELQKLYEEGKVKTYWDTFDDKVKWLNAAFKNYEAKNLKTIGKWTTFINEMLNQLSDDDELELSTKGLLIELKLIFDRVVPNESSEKGIEFEENENKDTYTKDWKRIFEILNDASIQALIITLQWEKVDEVVNKEYGLKATWTNKLIADGQLEKNNIKYFLFNQLLKIGELKHLEQYAIVSGYKNSIIDETNQDIPIIVDKVIEAVIEYADTRISNKNYYPFTQDPLNGKDQVTWDEFKIFIKEYLKSSTNKLGTGSLKETVQNCIEKPFDISPSVFLKVDSFGNPDNKEDLNDEIAGHIVLMKRSDKAGEFNSDWRYLNRVKVSLKKKKEQELEAQENFNNKYVIPTFIPESIELGKKPFLELRNERLSLIAGHDTFNDSEDTTEKNENQLVYKFDDNENAAYALWYGYEYQFAGFVALNSGVLPEFLREDVGLIDAGVNWNTPKKNFKTINNGPIQISEDYLHRRRVPVSKVRVEPTTKVLSPPKGLLPLAFELPEWKGDEVIKSNEKTDFEQTHYLLAKGNLSQKSITLELKKPTTTFWNWYAWLGEIANPEEEGESLAQQALSKELAARNAPREDVKRNQNILCDPAVENFLYIKLDRLFPTFNKNILKGKISLTKIGTMHNLLSDFKFDLPINYSENETKLTLDRNGDISSIEIKKGEVIKIKIHSLINKEHFGSNGKFYSWMNNVTTTNKMVIIKEGEIPKTYYLSKQNELWFEAAKPIATIEKTQEKLWKNLKISQDADNINCSIIKNSENFEDFAYASRVEIKHQVWNWNGRLMGSEHLLNSNFNQEDLDPNPELEPEHRITTEAMKWEAWAFSDRPDYSALVQDSNLVASRIIEKDSAEKQILFTDNRPNEEKALYYRFTAIAHSRYEKLGEHYQIPIEAKISVGNEAVDNVWKRFLRKSSKTKQLPKPSIRFVIPLTRSIKECDEKDQSDDGISAASLLIVLNDRWFTEAGLAEQLEFGIDVLKNPQESGGDYLNAGNDPILTGTSLSAVEDNAVDIKSKDWYVEEVGDKKVVVFKPEGPAGLTFEPKMQTPLLRGSSFILNIPDVTGLLQDPKDKNQGNKMQSWSLMQIAVRRTLRKPLCEDGISIEALRSDWTAKEWVQFLPAVDSFIPNNWRTQVRNKGAINCTFEGGVPKIPNIELPKFDTVFEERMHRYLVVTERVYDIGGQPTENYVGAFKYEEPSFSICHTDKKPEYLDNVKEGYCRLLLVRIDLQSNNDEKTDIWKMLFGENTKNVDINSIQNDPTAALPLVSERIPFKNDTDLNKNLKNQLDEIAKPCEGSPKWEIAPTPSHNPLDNMEWATGKEKDKFGCTRTHADGSKKFHAGIDIKAEIGTDCFATEDAKVTDVGYGPSLGHWVAITYSKNGKTYGVAYCHLSKQSVKNDDEVKKGQKIGETGISGNAERNNPHLHLEIQDQIWKTYNKPSERSKHAIDPNDYISELI